jgi:DNA-binding response OmpR family regulator
LDERPKILIVEDEADFAKMVRMRLESEGYEVTVAENVHVGTQEILKGDHELVILDLMMPEDEGFSVVRRMRRFPGRTSTPVVILTGKDIDDKVRDTADAYGVAAVYSKPYDSVKFVEEIKSLLPVDPLDGDVSKQ